MTKLTHLRVSFWGPGPAFLRVRGRETVLDRATTAFEQNGGSGDSATKQEPGNR